jgi:hypothetical protein
MKKLKTKLKLVQNTQLDPAFQISIVQISYLVFDINNLFVNWISGVWMLLFSFKKISEDLNQSFRPFDCLVFKNDSKFNTLTLTLLVVPINFKKWFSVV